MSFNKGANMVRTLLLKSVGIEVTAELNSSPVADLIWDMLPMKVSMNRWGDEYYGSCGINAGMDDTGREIMEVGELAYWPPGDALCIFFGPTPASTDGKPKAASPVVPVGKITGDPGSFKSLAVNIDLEVMEG